VLVWEQTLDGNAPDITGQTIGATSCGSSAELVVQTGANSPHGFIGLSVLGKPGESLVGMPHRRSDCLSYSELIKIRASEDVRANGWAVFCFGVKTRRDLCSVLLTQSAIRLKKRQKPMTP
jgi:hypothetical protein